MQINFILSLSDSRKRKNQRERLPTAFLPLKIAHVFLKRKNSLRSNSLRFLTENFPDFLNAPEMRSGETIREVNLKPLFS